MVPLMKAMRLFVAVLLAAASALAVVGWRKAAALEAEAQALRAQHEEAKQAAATASAEEARKASEQQQKAQTLTRELMQLRGEVTQLRTGGKDAAELRAENQRLRNQLLKAQPGEAGAAAVRETPKDHFPRENWTFAGYGTPESALVSAVWAMKEGDPKTYLESLSPEEQQRMAKVWENKSETEIAAKHQSDVGPIKGVRILETQNVSPEEVVMNVYIDGVERLEKVSMKKVGEDWKFGGFIREPKK